MTTRKYYTNDELADAWKADLLNDARCAAQQAESGPYYPEKGITRESLLAYAAKCFDDAGKPIPVEFAHNQ